MAIVYSKRMFIERIRKHIADGFPDQTFPASENEVLLYIDAAIPFVLKGQMFENAKVFGVFEVPEAYLVTYTISSLTKNRVTGEWYGTLPQTPLALPTGYNINDAYFSDNTGQRGQPVFLIEAKRSAMRDFMPKPNGVSARIEGNKIYMKSNSGYSLYGLSLYIQMPISRTADMDAAMNLPDDAIEPIFQKVVAEILQRYQIPKDIVLDNLPAGNKSS